MTDLNSIETNTTDDTLIIREVSNDIIDLFSLKDVHPVDALQALAAVAAATLYSGVESKYAPEDRLKKYGEALATFAHLVLDTGSQLYANENVTVTFAQ